MKLKGKVALITGGGSGIGASVAERFVAEGALVCIAGRRREMLDRVVRSLPQGTTMACPGDVSNLDDARRMVRETLAFGGRLDVLVNNAALDQNPSNVIDIDPEVWRRLLEVNLSGPFFLMKASIPHMIEGGGGSIVNIASLAGLRSLTEHARLLRLKGRPYQAHAAGGPRLRPFEGAVQCHLSRRGEDRDDRGGHEPLHGKACHRRGGCL